ncbi:hypothetical protein [Nocardia pseudobrasiliensis]|uniref:Uncharacterized protein n=1 Tax=Nocardia pseudobrasiliensis TaxID=45979 RepID=A0A370IA89_9NOCA|nr:hypothetical protein [Nocardia pseudobrasiliensis]RDI67530.1 hypothetical protein DFR76_103601 [Nocardia pseudobrasiliensis]
MGRWLVAVLMVIAVGTACDSGTSSTWTELSMPAPGARVSAIVAVGNEVLVSGALGGHPGAWIGSDGKRWRAVRLEAHSGYAPAAELISVGVGERVVALGQAFGGAHSNPRMTIWSGDAGALVEYPQAFELFGGPHAIAVTAAATIGGTDLLIGEWDGPGGRYGSAVWLSRDGRTWQRSAEDPALSSAPGEQTGAAGVATGPAGFVIAGNTLRDGVLIPLVWTSPDGRAWQRRELSGAAAIATRAACDTAGCATAGQSVASPRLLCWPDPTAPPVPGPTASRLELSQLFIHDNRILATARLDGRAHLLSVHRDCTVWQDIPLPTTAGEARLGTLPDGRLLLATADTSGSRLWTTR